MNYQSLLKSNNRRYLQHASSQEDILVALGECDNPLQGVNYNVVLAFEANGHLCDVAFKGAGLPLHKANRFVCIDIE